MTSTGLPGSMTSRPFCSFPAMFGEYPASTKGLNSPDFDKCGLLHPGGRVAVEWRNDKPYAHCLDDTLKPGSFIIAPDAFVPTPPREAVERAEEIASRTDPFYRPPAELRAVPPPPPPYLAER